MDTGIYRYDGGKTYKTVHFDTGATKGVGNKVLAERMLAQNVAQIEQWQEKLFADGKQALLVVLQAMDAAGKDGTIKYVFSGVNPEGIVVANFKQPSAREASRDFLWRVHRAVPRRGMIGIFNRSHYEDVLVARVMDTPKALGLPGHALRDIWKKRYRQIRDFERMLYENGTTIVKFFLNISREEQRERFLDRLENPAKNWKFSVNDLPTSTHWDAYMKVYEACINETGTEYAPWYVVPGNHKWYARLLVSQVVLDTLRGMKPEFPKVSREQKVQLGQIQKQLEMEQKAAKA